MPRPEFTPYKEHLIASVKLVEVAKAAQSYGFIYLLMGTLVFLAGIPECNLPMLIAGFGIVAVGRLYEEHWYRKQTPMWRSIVQKFEAACDEGPAADSHTTTLM